MRLNWLGVALLTVSAQSLPSEAGTIETIKERKALACISRSTLRELFKLYARHDGSYERDVASEIATTTCTFLLPGQKVEILEAGVPGLFPSKFRVGIDSYTWWLDPSSFRTDAENNEALRKLEQMKDEFETDHQRKR